MTKSLGHPQPLKPPSKSLDQYGREFNVYSGARPTLAYGAERIGQEYAELVDAVLELTRRDAQPTDMVMQAIRMELADIVLTAASIAAQHNLDLAGAVAEKHAVNMKRQWVAHRDGSVSRNREAVTPSRLSLKDLPAAAWEPTKLEET